jgi:hypothetical protein
MIISPDLTAYQARRAALLADITAALAADERFVAAWLTGSYGRDDADAVSDLDISVIVAAVHSTSLCARLAEVGGRTTSERYALFSQFGRPVVLHENNRNCGQSWPPRSRLANQSSLNQQLASLAYRRTCHTSGNPAPNHNSTYFNRRSVASSFPVSVA